MAKNAQIRIVTGLLNDFAGKVVTRLSVNVTARLIKATPVDTGWARANWIPAIGVPILDTTAVKTREEREGAVSGKAAQQAAGTAKLLGYRLARGKVFISNNVPYITRLNDGSSRKAPSGFVQTAIIQTVIALQRSGIGVR